MYSMKHLSMMATFLVLSFFSFTMMAAVATDIVVDEKGVVTTIQADGNTHLTEAHIRDGRVVIAVAEDAKFEAESVTAYASVTLYLSGNAVVEIGEVRAEGIIVHAKGNSSIRINEIYVDGAGLNIESDVKMAACIMVVHQNAHINVQDNAQVSIETFWAKKMFLSQKGMAFFQVLSNANIPFANIYNHQSRSDPHLEFAFNKGRKYGAQSMKFGGVGKFDVGLRRLWNMRAGRYTDQIRRWAREIYEGKIEYSCYNYRGVPGMLCGVIHTPQSVEEVEDALLETSILPLPDQYLNKDLCDFLDLDRDGSLYRFAKQYAERYANEVPSSAK